MLRKAWNRVYRVSQYRSVQLVSGGVASVGLAWAALHRLEWGKVLETFQQLPLGLAFASLVPLAFSLLLRAARWYVLMRGEPVNFRQVLLTQNTGFGLNNLLPIRMVAEPVQLALITRRYHVPFPAALASLVAANVLDIFATAILMTLGVLLVPGLRGASIQLGGAVALAIVTLLVFIAVSKGLSAIPVAKGMRFFQQLMIAVGLLRDQPWRLWASFGLTVSHWALLGVSGWILAEGFDISVNPLTMATVLVAATFFTSAVPSLPAAAGTYEFAVILTLQQMGIDSEAAFSFAVVMHVMVFLPSSAIAVYMLSRVGAGMLLHRADGAEDSPAGEEVSMRARGTPQHSGSD